MAAPAAGWIDDDVQVVLVGVELVGHVVDPPESDGDAPGLRNEPQPGVPVVIPVRLLVAGLLDRRSQVRVRPIPDLHRMLVVGLAEGAHNKAPLPGGRIASYDAHG